MSKLEPFDIKPLRISHSQKRAFLKCPRSWELRYNAGYTRRNVNDKKPMMLGSAVHAGIATALTELYKEGEFLIHRATKAAEQWVIDNTVANKMYYVQGGGFQPDGTYYQMMREISEDAVKILRYYLPRMELGTRYEVVGTDELFKGSMLNYGDTADKPCVELPFETVIPELIMYNKPVVFSGIIDAILRDKTTGEIILTDFKVRGTFPYDQLAGLDDQLFIYAALLSRVGVRVDNVCMFQIRSKLPSKASISKAGTPNLGGQNDFDTTEDMWLATLPANVDPKVWLPKVAGKFKPLSEFIRPIFMQVTSDTHNLTYLNVIATAEHMMNALTKDSYPATLDQSVCKQCEFWKLCSGLQYGGDPAIILEQEYERKDGYEEMESTD